MLLFPVPVLLFRRLSTTTIFCRCIREMWLTISLGNDKQVLNVAYSADGDYLAMSDKSENLRLVDVRNGKNKVSQGVPEFVENGGRARK